MNTLLPNYLLTFALNFSTILSMSNIRWRRKVLTEEDVQHMILDYNQNMPIKDITAKYGITKSTLYNKLREQDTKTNE